MATRECRFGSLPEELYFRTRVKEGQVVAFDATTLSRYYTDLVQRMGVALTALEAEPEGERKDLYRGIAQSMHGTAALFAGICAYQGTPTADNRVTLPIVGTPAPPTDDWVAEQLGLADRKEEEEDL